MVAHLAGEKRFAGLEAAGLRMEPAVDARAGEGGFVREGTLRRSVTKDGQLIDSVLYALVLEP